MTFVAGPLGYAIGGFHHSLTVEDVCCRLEVEWYFAARKGEGGRVCQDGVATLVENGGSAHIAGHLADGHVNDSREAGLAVLWTLQGTS